MQWERRRCNSQCARNNKQPRRRTRPSICAARCDWLRATGELIETDKEVDPDLQVTGLQKHMDGGCPVLFNNVKGKPNHRVITNLFGDMAIINQMFGWKDDAERVRKLAHALSHPMKPVEIAQSEAPCQEFVDREAATTSTNGWCRSATPPTSRS